MRKQRPRRFAHAVCSFWVRFHETVFNDALLTHECRQRDYYRQDQEEVLSTPLEIARELPEDILRLAGYYKSIGGVGFVEDHQHPVEFLQEDQTGLGKFVSAAKVAV